MNAEDKFDIMARAFLSAPYRSLVRDESTRVRQLAKILRLTWLEGFQRAMEISKRDSRE